MIKYYYSLTKPGIIYGNALAVLAGFFLAVKGDIDVVLVFATLFGISLVMASGCVFNNYIDRDIDALMERTKKRVLVQGVISPKHALVFGGALGTFGFLILFIFTNFLTTIIAAVGFIFYVIVYSLWGKRHSIYGTMLGSVSGAVPPVVGYCALTNQLDLGALLLFLFLCVWQMPHSYAIAIYRLPDYRAAKLPVLPVVKGVRDAKVHIGVYIIASTILALLFFVFGYTSQIFFWIMLTLSLVWLYFSWQGFRVSQDEKWAKKMFLLSILVLVAFCTLIIGEGIFSI